MEDLKKRIGERLRLRRESLGLTQGDIAKSLGVALTTIHRTETGAFSPSLETLVSYSRVVGMTVDEVLGQPEVEHPVRLPSSREVVEIVREALKLADNPIIQRIARLPAHELAELEKRIAMIEHRLAAEAQRLAKLSKKVE